MFFVFCFVAFFVFQDSSWGTKFALITMFKLDSGGTQRLSNRTAEQFEGLCVALNLTGDACYTLIPDRSDNMTDVIEARPAPYKRCIWALEGRWLWGDRLAPAETGPSGGADCSGFGSSGHCTVCTVLSLHVAVDLCEGSDLALGWCCHAWPTAPDVFDE